MLTIAFRVQGCPPWKQGPADSAEKERQDELKHMFTTAMKAAYGGQPMTGRCALQVVYSRGKGRMDSANILGGIADALQKHVYDDDRQVVSISYLETEGDEDWYHVTVVQLG